MGLVKKSMVFWHFKIVFFSPPLLKAWGDFSLILWGPDRASGGKTQENCVSSMTRCPCTFWLSDLFTLSLQQIHHSPGLPTPALVPMGNSVPVNMIVSICLLMEFVGEQFSLWRHFSGTSKKSCWFLSLFSFLLGKTDWQILSSLYARLEIVNLY